MAKIHYIRKYENEMTYRSFNELLLWTCLSLEATAQLCGVTPRTVREWKKKNDCPVGYKRLLEWYYYGVPQTKDWGNWKLRNGLLVSPGGMEFNSKKLEMVQILNAWYQEEKIKLKKKIRYDKKKGFGNLSLIPKNKY